MAVNPSPFGPKPQFELSDGTPAVGNKLFFYVAGSVSTKQNTYNSSTGLSANTNPIILNTLGQPTNAEIWFTQGLSYKVVYAPSTDTDPPTSPIWTVDHLLGINDVSVSQDQWVSFTGAPTFVGATSFTLVGDQTSTFHVGRRLKTTNSGGTVYSTIITSAFAALTTITVVNDSGTLDAGLSAVSYGLLSYTTPSAPNNSYMPPGAIMDFGGATAPTGWLECDGSSVLRATYPALFTAISTVWGAVDGTHFTLPDFRSKARLGKGTGTAVESVTNAAINTGTDQITVASNSTKWTTGMQVTWTVSGTPPTTNPANLLDNNDVVFIIRVSSTVVKVATTLALAQAGTAIDITAAGAGTFTMTTTYAARTLGEYGGEEAHAQSSAESLLHVHFVRGDGGGGAGSGILGSANGGPVGGENSDPFGGNAAMNIMQPFAVTMAIIKT